MKDNDQIIEVLDRQADLDEINKLSWRKEHGIRTICVMYDEHSADKHSKENIYKIKDNVHYRVFAIKHQYLVYLRELIRAEQSLQKLYKSDPKNFNAFLYKNPHFEKVDLELTSVFDNIIFQLTSMFDYISHLISYICKTDKSKTIYWTKLVASARDKNNELNKLKISKTILEIDNELVGKLYDYRSRIIHNKKDIHRLKFTLQLNGDNFKIQTLCSELSLSHFKSIKKEYSSEKITLTFLSSWLIKKSYSEIEKLLGQLRLEILKSSNYAQNVTRPKSQSLMIIRVDPQTNIAEPVSEKFWEQYKNPEYWSRPTTN